MKNKKFGLERMLKFFEERGFYIILFLCIGAIGISGYVLFFEGKNAVQLDENSNIEEFGSKNYPIEEAPVINETPVEIPSNKTEEKTNKNADIKVNNPVPTPETPFYVRPVSGTVLKAFSGDKLTKDETMGDWRVHKGIDFKTLDGERVSAIADGTVKDIYYDEMLGYCIRIAHDNGIESLYCNLMKNATVKKGDTVKSGDIIGGVGSSMLAESAESPHLHFELLKNGKEIDPQSILPKK
ncbi:MAG: M23 family metallopeptidase [Clostridiales bacterium]|nr:M23 family metallopeptidase [Clostridiales bacterium]